jgi:Ras family
MDGVIIVTDSTNPRSFRAIGRWKNTVEDLYHTESEDDSSVKQPLVFLMCNKSDHEQSMIRAAEVANSVDGFNLAGGSLVSAKSGSQINDFFDTVIMERLLTAR